MWAAVAEQVAAYVRGVWAAWQSPDGPLARLVPLSTEADVLSAFNCSPSLFQGLPMAAAASPHCGGG